MNNNNREQEKNDRKLDNLINIVENHTRTERHLEQYSDICNPENKEEATQKQHLREKQANELNHQLAGYEPDIPSKQEQLDGLKRNYQFGEGYIKNNSDHMAGIDLQNLQEKQQNRKIQIENLEQNIKNND